MNSKTAVIVGKKILTFGASNSINSINKKLAIYAAQQLDGVQLKIVDLNDFDMPIYSIDREKKSGIPELAKQFKNEINTADGIIISFAEHNGSFTAAFKNILDWVSRINKDFWGQKPMLLLATSPGARGAKSVLMQASNSFRRSNHNTILEFSLPSFNTNFDIQEGITNVELKESFQKQLELFEAAVKVT